MNIKTKLKLTVAVITIIVLTVLAVLPAILNII